MGARFDALVTDLTTKGARDPQALAAHIGRKKYGKTGINQLAAAGRRMKGGTSQHRSAAGAVLESGTEVRQHLYRAVWDMEIKPGGDGRTVHGIAVPYNQVMRIDDNLVETFDGDANHGPFDHQMRSIHNVDYWNLHSIDGGTAVGHVKEAHNDAAGLYTESYVRRSAEGDQTLEDIRKGRRPHQSVGFDITPGGTHYRSGVAHRVKADLFELAAVPQGAYGAGATVQAVRSAQGITDEQLIDLANEIAAMRHFA